MSHDVQRVVVDGLYGIQSYGDDAMLLTLVRELSRRVPRVEFNVLSRHPEELQQRYGIPALQNLDHPVGVRPIGEFFYGFNPGQPRDHIERIRTTIARSDLLVIGGGNLLLDVTHDWLRGPIAWHAFSSGLARCYQVPYALYCQSMGPFRTDWGRDRAAQIVRDAANVTVRDAASLHFVEQAGLAADRTAQLPDAALLLEPDVQAADAVWERIGRGAGRGPTIGISVRDLSWRDGSSDYFTALVHVAQRLIDEYEATLVCIPQCSYAHGSPEEDDRNVARRLCERIRRPGFVRLLDEQYQASTILGFYRGLDVALVTRLHGAVFAAAVQTPFLAVSYLPKVDGFLNEIDHADWCVDMTQLGQVGEIAQRLMGLVAQRDAFRESLRRAVDQAKARAARHFDCLGELLTQRAQRAAAVGVGTRC